MRWEPAEPTEARKPLEPAKPWKPVEPAEAPPVSLSAAPGSDITKRKTKKLPDPILVSAFRKDRHWETAFCEDRHRLVPERADFWVGRYFVL